VAPPAMVPGAIIVQGVTSKKRGQFTIEGVQEVVVIPILVLDMRL